MENSMIKFFEYHALLPKPENSRFQFIIDRLKIEHLLSAGIEILVPG